MICHGLGQKTVPNPDLRKASKGKNNHLNVGKRVQKQCEGSGPRKVCRVPPWPTCKISRLEKLAPIGKFSVKMGQFVDIFQLPYTGTFFQISQDLCLTTIPRWLKPNMCATNITLPWQTFDLEKGAARQVPWKSISSIKFVWKMTENQFYVYLPCQDLHSFSNFPSISQPKWL